MIPTIKFYPLLKCPVILRTGGVLDKWKAQTTF